MVRTRVKICGITRLEDAQLAVSLGADALGFVFVPASARHVTVEAARDIARRAAALRRPRRDCSSTRRSGGGGAGAGGAARGSSRSSTGARRRRACDAFGRGYLKALGVAEGLPVRPEELAAYRRAEGFLLDSNVPGELGGTGHAFDWTRLDRGAMGRGDRRRRDRR